MTFQTDQIQAMIAEIDEVLNQSSGFGLGWLTSKESAQQRQVLEQVRYQLQTLQQQLARAAAFEPKSTQSSSQANSNPQLQQARSEIATLRQQRQALVQEIEQLEQQRQNYLSQQQQPTQQQQAIADFFAALMGNLQETLTPQLVQTLSHLETDFLTDRSPSIPPPANNNETNITLPPQWQAQAEQLRIRQTRLDRLLKALDDKLNLMFETLQLNLHKYRSSLSGGLEKMHGLSAESEALLNDLIAQMERELEPTAIAASAEITATPAAETTSPPSTPGLLQPTPSFNQGDADDLPLPYAGFEWKSPIEPPSDTDRINTEAESIEGDSNLENVYGGMGGLVAQTAIAASQSQAPSFTDTIGSLTDLIENSALGQPSSPSETDVLSVSVATDALATENLTNLEPTQSPELDKSANNWQPKANLNDTAEIPAASAATAEDEEIASAIPDDILAEFDELFGAPNQDATSDIKADSTAPELDEINASELEKKNIAATERQTKVSTTDSDSFFTAFDRPLLTPPRFWYLGIDFGTTGISAALFNAKTRQVYPITWSIAGQMDGREALFRLPAEVYLKSANSESPTFLIAPENSVAESGIWLKNLKQYLKICLPYQSPETGNWQPTLQQSNMALNWVTKALQALLLTLKPDPEERENVNEKVSISAVGLEPESLQQALSELAGAIASTPAEWPEAYRFNVREAILGANLVEHQEQICFAEEAIASTIAQIVQANVSLRGDTLIIHAGATTTELGLVELPENIALLSYSDFACRSFPYAGNFIDQDIICQLLLRDEAGSIVNRLINSQNASLEMPLAGEPDLATRYRLQQILESSPTGQLLLEAAKHLKLNLQHQDSDTLEIERFRWVVQRQTLENLVYSPFIQCLNRELNVLLVRQGVAVESIRQVICTGGTARIDAIREWLRQKLPNATLIQDINQNASVALGLVTLPLYPLLLDAPRHQYGDYFLLLELLRNLREQPLSVGKITQLLERQGINMSANQQRILAYLEGYLPPGIIPSYADALLLTEASRQNAILASAPLFDKEDDRTYRLNAETGDRLRDYFNAVLVRSRQKFEEPLGVYWLTPAVNR